MAVGGGVLAERVPWVVLVLIGCRIINIVLPFAMVTA